MFENIIEFSAHEDYFSLNEDFPIPSKLNIPDWYKKLDHTTTEATVKGCMPFLDSLIIGYILKMPQDFHVKHNVDNVNDKGQPIKDSFQTFSLHLLHNALVAKSINLNAGIDVHPIKQLHGCPYVEKNKNLPIYKILNPWKIKTPRGYSCLFVPPLNNSDDRFSIIPGVVDTDVFPVEINFPMVINGDKYPTLETTIKKGTPYVQVIPFKRDAWKMKTKPVSPKKVFKSWLSLSLKLIGRYKEDFWNKKVWK